MVGGMGRGGGEGTSGGLEHVMLSGRTRTFMYFGFFESSQM